MQPPYALGWLLAAPHRTGRRTATRKGTCQPYSLSDGGKYPRYCTLPHNSWYGNELSRVKPIGANELTPNDLNCSTGKEKEIVGFGDSKTRKSLGFSAERDSRNNLR